MGENKCFIFFNAKKGCDLTMASNSLAQYGLTIARNADEISAWFPGKPILQIRFSSGHHVQTTVSTVSQATAFHKQMANCDAQFEIRIDDMDSTLDEINTLIDVQTCLQKMTHGFIYCNWNDSIVAP